MPEANNKGVDISKFKKHLPPRGLNYLLVIAINDYDDFPTLYNCIRDAEDLIGILVEYYRFEKDRIIKLLDKDATRQGIYNAFRDMAEKVTEKDNLLIYFSGHGEIDDVFREGAWIPYDAHDKKVHNFLFNSEVKMMLNAINSHHTFLMVDSCFSGSFFSDAQDKDTGKRYEGDPSRWVLTSGKRKVSDGKPGDNSPFAESLLKNLKNNIEPLGVQELCVKVVDEVEKATKDKQTPIGQPLWIDGHKNGQFVFRQKKYAYDLIKVEGGSMDVLLLDGMTGNSKSTGQNIRLKDYYLAAYPVTFEDFDEFCESVSYSKPTDEGWGRGRRPVINIDWFEALTYCNWLSSKHGLQLAYLIVPGKENKVIRQPHSNGYRLPTEIEWEYAARQGGQLIRFGNGKSIASPEEMNFNGSRESDAEIAISGVFRNRTTPVNQFAPNDLGFYDFCGNVWEWCWNWYNKSYDYLKLPPGQFGPPNGELRVCRGGSWLQPPEFCQVTARYGDVPINGNAEIGFRLARNV